MENGGTTGDEQQLGLHEIGLHKLGIREEEAEIGCAGRNGGTNLQCLLVLKDDGGWAETRSLWVTDGGCIPRYSLFLN